MADTRGPAATVRVWVASLAEADVAFQQWLDVRERERLSAYEGEADRARFLLGAAMLRSAAGSVIGSPPSDVVVDRTCRTCGGWHGRPVVPRSGLALSVSHSGLLVVLALAVGSPVGVDVERADRSGRQTLTWTGTEARFKAGGHPSLVVRQLPTPLPGYVLSLAATADVSVQMRPGKELLSRS